MSSIIVTNIIVIILVMTLVSLSKTLNYNCFSWPWGKWVPMRAVMVLVIDLAYSSAIMLKALYKI